jgi:hypothetical protein
MTRLSELPKRTDLTATWELERLQIARSVRFELPKQRIVLEGGPLDGCWEEYELTPDYLEAGGGVYLPVLLTNAEILENVPQPYLWRPA